jgi:hypothetical protein
VGENWVVASDLPQRIVELRDSLGDSVGDFMARFGRGENQFWEWKSGRQLPRRGTLVQAARAFGWSVAMFAEGGPRPKDAVNRPGNEGIGRTVKEGSPPPYGASDAELGALPPDQVLFRLSMELAEYLDKGRPLSVSRGMWMLEQAFRAGARGAEVKPDRRTGTGE